MIMENRSLPESAVQPFESNVLCSEPKHGDIFHMPLGLKGYFDYKQGLECAAEQKKPVLIDFKGHACANCKRMEAKIWSNPEILSRLRSVSYTHLTLPTNKEV